MVEQELHLNFSDDYEEGFFTPTIYQGADNGSGGDPSFSMDKQEDILK